MSKYIDTDINSVLNDNSYYIFMGGRNCGKAINTIPRFLEFMFGGICEYRFEPSKMIHHYLIHNDDIGFMDMTVTSECFMYENLDTRFRRMCEEYNGYMNYKFRDSEEYITEKERWKK